MDEFKEEIEFYNKFNLINQSVIFGMHLVEDAIKSTKN